VCIYEARHQHGFATIDNVVVGVLGQQF